VAGNTAITEAPLRFKISATFFIQQLFCTLI
jgi:hypothetical protein